MLAPLVALLSACESAPDSASKGPDSQRPTADSIPDSGAEVESAGDSDTAADPESGSDTGLDSAPPEPPPYEASCLTGLEEGYFRDTVAADPGAPVLADVNADGRLDLVVPAEGEVSAWLGRGDGVFTPSHTLSTGTRGLSAGVADLDGDSVVDLVYLESGGTIVVHAGSADGTFAVAGTATATGCTAPSELVVADVDGDGLSDVIVACADPALVVLQGPATSFSATMLAPSAAAAELVVSDLDADGDVDLATLVGTDTLETWENDGAGGWSRRASVTATGASGLAAGDLDADGDVDLVAGTFYPFDLVWFVNDGDGDYASTIVPGLWVYWSWGIADVAVLDADGDGIDDVVATGTSVDDQGASLHVFTGSTAGPTWVAGYNPNMESWLARLGVGDVDNDGLDDVAVVGGEQRVYVHRAEGAGYFGDTTWLGGTGESGGWNLLADMNGDGLDDVVGARAWFLADGAGGWSDAVPTFDDDGYSAAVADLDGDGDRDVIVADGAVIDLSFNDGAGGTEGGVSIDPRGLGVYYAYAAVPGDLDTDGDADLVVASQNAYGFVALFNDGAANFIGGAVVDPGLPSGVVDLALAELTGDGVLDIVLIEAAGDESQVWAGDGAGGFTLAWSATSAQPVRSLDVGDIDGDGDDDVVIVAGDGEEEPSWVELLENDAGMLSRHTVETTGFAYGALAELDGDGHLDLVLTDIVGNGLTAWLGDGAFGWNDLGPVPDAAGVTTLAPTPGDPDGDGDVDLAVYTTEGTFVLYNGCE